MYRLAGEHGKQGSENILALLHLLARLHHELIEVSLVKRGIVVHGKLLEALAVQQLVGLCHHVKLHFLCDAVVAQHVAVGQDLPHALEAVAVALVAAKVLQ